MGRHFAALWSLAVGDLLRIFRAYGRPDHFGDVKLVEYIFNGDFVDRGSNSIEVVLLLFSLKVPLLSLSLS